MIDLYFGGKSDSGEHKAVGFLGIIVNLVGKETCISKMYLCIFLHNMYKFSVPFTDHQVIWWTSILPEALSYLDLLTPSKHLTLPLLMIQ